LTAKRAIITGNLSWAGVESDQLAGVSRLRWRQDKPLTAGQLPESDLEVRRLMEAGRLVEANVLFDKCRTPTACC